MRKMRWSKAKTRNESEEKKKTTSRSDIYRTTYENACDVNTTAPSTHARVRAVLACALVKNCTAHKYSPGVRRVGVMVFLVNLKPFYRASTAVVNV